MAHSDVTPFHNPGSEEETTTQSKTTHPHPHIHTRSTNANANPNTNAPRDNLLVMTAYMDAMTGSRDLSRGQHQPEIVSVPVHTPRLSRAKRDLLSEDVTVFRENIPAIATQVGRRLVEIERGLGEMSRLAIAMTVTTRDTNGDRQDHHHTQTSIDAPPPPPPTTTLVESLRLCRDRRTSLRSSLPPRLSDLSNTLTRLLSLQRDQLASAIRSLEATKHGTVSRHVQARSAFFATVARAMDLKTRLVLLEERGRVENSDAVKTKRATVREKMRQIVREDAEVSARLDDLRRVVGEYDAVEHTVGHSRGVMTRLGKRYGEIEKEMDTVKSDIEKLQRQQNQQQEQGTRKW
jgi:gas vesicle protein